MQRGRVTIEEVGELFLANVRAKGRKPATLEVYSSTIRVHLAPFFAARTLDQIGRRAHGKRLVLLLSGYDKGARPSTRHQQREIERAHGHLKEWQATQAHERRTSKRSAKDRRARD